MPYTVLYRKKRPRNFSQMVGQPHIVEALRNQLRANQTAHAYLFCGTRGTGKTTAAKIMARAINCTDLQEGDPCNTCPTCESILSDRCLDVAEIDAASNNGVDDIRNLRDEVKYPPTECTTKVYIIDEVHMLSSSAFNALLKTLEEPPPHVVFILATTDPQKVPVTVLSRCQRYDFRRIKTPEIIGALSTYLNQESCAFEEEALAYIAYHCDGAMRDALSLLDQALSLRESAATPLTLAVVRDLLGAVDRAVLFKFTQHLASQDGYAVLSIIDTAAKDGRDMGQFTADLVRHFRDVLVASLISNTDGLDVSADVAEQLKAQGATINAEQLMHFILVFSELLRELRFAPHKRTALEVSALGLCANDQPLTHEPPLPLPTAPTATTPTAPPILTPTTPTATSLTPSTIIPTSLPTNDLQQALVAIPNDWASLCITIAYPLRSWLVRCKVTVQGELVQITCDNEAENERIKSHQMTIREAIADRYQLTTPPNLAFAVGTAKKAATKRPAVETYPDASIPPPPEDNSPPSDINDEWAAFGQASIDGDSPF